MEHQVHVQRSAVAHDDRPAEYRDDSTTEVLPDVAYKRLLLVNIVFLGEEGSRKWMLVDAGISGSASSIIKAAEERFGQETAPSAIVLTHAHFDHVGALEELIERWHAPVYAHPDEFPFLTGEKNYPPPNVDAGGGIMPALSRFFPTKPIDIRGHLRPIPEDGTLPVESGWRWLHTPGHTRGHISFWRPSDKTMVAGDAFITTKQESAYAIITQEPELHGPPMYFTEDWQRAYESLRRLAWLMPELAITGHGRALSGEGLQRGLKTLAEEFWTRAVPENRL